jgi:trehalose 6-phosphate phosphatase
MTSMQRAIDHLLDAQPLALVTDFDGTISQIASTPEGAAIHPRCLDSLAKLSRKLTLVAVVSGRQVEEVRRLVGLAGVIYIGNHGLERWEEGTKYVDPVASRYATAIRDILARARDQLTLPGLVFEDKGVTASIHYRNATDPETAGRQVVTFLRDLAVDSGLRLVEGRCVIELRPPVDVDKGTAMLGLLQAYEPGSVVYAGDDRTDLDAFAAIHRWAVQQNRRALAVGVMSPEAPPQLTEEADLLVGGVDGWANFLAALVEAWSGTAAG